MGVMFTSGLLLPPLSALGWVLLFQFAWRRIGAQMVRLWLQSWIGGCIGGGTVAAIGHTWAYMAGAAVSLAIALAICWRRRKRRRVARLVGAKARALRDKLVRRARETARPRPVLRPVPGGVR